MLNKEIKKYIDQSVLCWLATTNSDGIPNVSPKEIFTYDLENNLLIANIASPKSINNIKYNNNVCISLIDIFIQKGYKLLGEAKLLNPKDIDFKVKVKNLQKIAGNDFKIKSIICIKIKSVEKIIAPSYRFYPETSEASQIQNALNTYDVEKHFSSKTKFKIENFLASSRKQFQYYKMLGEQTFEQLSEQELFWKNSDSDNSIAIIVNHLAGNMLSRWTNFLTEDGEKTWRNREEEFHDIIENKKHMLEKWQKAWACLFDALNTINDKNFHQLIYIRNMGHTISEAINRQMTHYAYHIGQIVLIGKILKKENWKNLSIPKGKSEQYNQEKFSKGKRKKHFITEFMEDISKIK